MSFLYGWKQANGLGEDGGEYVNGEGEESAARGGSANIHGEWWGDKAG